MQPSKPMYLCVSFVHCANEITQCRLILLDDAEINVIEKKSFDRCMKPRRKVNFKDFRLLINFLLWQVSNQNSDEKLIRNMHNID